MLLPNEWIENCIETYIYQHTTKTQIIYWVVLFAITTTAVALPFVNVDISVRGNGVVRPVAEKAEISSSITEIVDSVFVSEGDQVKKGDVLLRFRTNSSDYRISYQTSRLDDYGAQLADLTYLSKGEKPQTFRSSMRQQEYAYFNRKKQELETTLAQAEKEHARNKMLFEKKLISEEEYDGYYFKLQNQRNELASLVQSQLSTWQTDLNACLNTYNEMNTSLKQEVKDKDTVVPAYLLGI